MLHHLLRERTRHLKGRMASDSRGLMLGSRTPGDSSVLSLDIGVQVLVNTNVTVHEGRVRRVVDSAGFL